MRQSALAWGVHFFTSLGLVAAAGMAVLIVHGGDAAFRAVFALMLVATLIDAFDGSLARLARVKTVLPDFDGRRLDDIIDFHTYTSVPLLLLWRAGILPGLWSALLLFPLLASVYGFSRSAAKTDDGYFLGFPSYWNIVAFYLYFLQPPFWFSAAVITLFSILTFVPTRYLYATQPGALNRLTNVLAGVWVVLLIWILVAAPDHRHAVTLASLFFPIFYFGASWWVELRTRTSAGVL
ncbi:MAG: CDP-alcohol phosphatidyltransferase [Acidobacteriota bacterium]|nr:CDP-alcohol phosphatidyltransferase [Acidobacteriota bacterium]